MGQSELSDDENLFSFLRMGSQRETDQRERSHDKPTQRISPDATNCRDGSSAWIHEFHGG